MKLLTPSFLLFACFVFGGIMFKSTTPSQCDAVFPDDSIFVLTGDTRRIPFAQRLQKKYPDAELYIIGDGAQTYREHLPNSTIETESKSTYQNATAIAQIIARTGLERIVLVTTEDHINRAQYLIRQELPDVEIIPCPAHLTGMPATKRLERWATEYVKYIVTMFGIKEG